VPAQVLRANEKKKGGWKFSREKFNWSCADGNAVGIGGAVR
jgi:hypothetical protein